MNGGDKNRNLPEVGQDHAVLRDEIAAYKSVLNGNVRYAYEVMRYALDVSRRSLET